VDDGLPAPKIRVRGLCRLSDTTGDEILRGVHLDVPRGVVMGVIGPSGSGKSTLLRALNRLWEPAPATVFLDGADICALDVLALRRKVGMLFQLPAMFQGTSTDPGRRSSLTHAGQKTTWGGMNLTLSFELVPRLDHTTPAVSYYNIVLVLPE
jgi:ABC-type methionine transport system ATPase subunit